MIGGKYPFCQAIPKDLKKYHLVFVFTQFHPLKLFMVLKVTMFAMTVPMGIDIALLRSFLKFVEDDLLVLQPGFLRQQD